MKYRLPLIMEKGAVFMIVLNAFGVLSYFSIASQLTAIADETAIEYAVIIALYPVIGLIADIWIGRYKILSIARYLLSTVVILNALKVLLFMLKAEKSF